MCLQHPGPFLAFRRGGDSHSKFFFFSTGSSSCVCRPRMENSKKSVTSESSSERGWTWKRKIWWEMTLTKEGKSHRRDTADGWTDPCPHPPFCCLSYTGIIPAWIPLESSGQSKVRYCGAAARRLTQPEDWSCTVVLGNHPDRSITVYT